MLRYLRCAPWGWLVGIKPAAVTTMLNFYPRSVVEHTPRDPEVAGSNPATFSSLILFNESLNDQFKDYVKVQLLIFIA